MTATQQVLDAYTALLADLKETAVELAIGLAAELTYRDDDERVRVPKIRSDAHGAMVWIDADGNQIPEAQFKVLYIDPTAARLQVVEDARAGLKNATENFAAIRNARTNYVR